MRKHQHISSTVKDQWELADSIEEIKKIVYQRIREHTAAPFIVGYQEQRSQLMDLLRRSATTGESNSAILIGSRGCGKTMLVYDCLAELMQEKDMTESMLQVNLNGFVQTDDRIALKEITRQLKLENTVGDKVFGSFSENLQFLLASLKSGGRRSKSILFVLDEFDAFTQHKNQTLLYNLFDVAQSAQTPICVLGLSCHLDVVELLEKRVRSRFSHRQIHLFINMEFNSFLELFKSTLSIPEHECGDGIYAREWNRKIEELSTVSAVQDVLKQRFMMSKDMRNLHSILVLPISKVNVRHPFLEASDFLFTKVLAQDPKAAMLHGVSILELCLSIAMKQLNEVYSGEPFNFEMVYNVYKKFADSKSSWQIFEKAVILKAFEHLMALELVRPVDVCGTNIQKEYRLVTLLVDNSEIMAALQKFPSCPTEVKQWATSAIVTN